MKTVAEASETCGNGIILHHHPPTLLLVVQIVVSYYCKVNDLRSSLEYLFLDIRTRFIVELKYLPNEGIVSGSVLEDLIAEGSVSTGKHQQFLIAQLHMLEIV